MKKERERRRKFKSNIRKIVSTILLIFFIGLALVSGARIVNYIKDSAANKKIIDEISEAIVIEETESNEDEEKTKEYKIDFAKLKEKNPDTVGFIKVNGTEIEYVVVKAKNNDYYINHNFEKQYNSGGWIFADYKNKFDGTDKNIILYGHNMRNGTMFATLKDTLNKSWCENQENRKITFITENGTDTYEVFSIYQIEVEDYYIKTNFSKGEFENFVKTLKSRSIYKFDTEVNEDDSIITLSTCGNDNKYRVVLHAKKVVE